MRSDHTHAVPDATRRRLLCCGALAAAGLFTGLGSARPQWPRAETPALPAQARDLVDAAFEGIDATRMWDVHTHLLGTGDGGSGCRVHPDLSSPWHPASNLRRRAILGAAAVDPSSTSVDADYVARLRRWVDDFPAGARWLLFAFDNAHDESGRPRPDWSTFHVPDAHARRVAGEHADRFSWVASVHPYRADALDRLHAAHAGGAVALKWLPGAMNIDLRDRRLQPIYDWLARTRWPLIVHTGAEHAVPGAGRHDLGHPLHARAPLEAGVRVVFAHCASIGHCADTESASGSTVSAFSLFARLMDAYPHALGDVSAVLQVNRRSAVASALLARRDWHARLLHGSDYPLPGVRLLHRPALLAHAGLLAADDLPGLEALHAHNPLLFDFVLKRRVRWAGQAFDASVFHTAGHWRDVPRQPIGRSPR